MIKLNVTEILKQQNKSKYWLFNELNKLRSTKEEPQISYTNFQNLIEQKNHSIKYRNIEELCYVLNCTIADLLTLFPKQK